MDDSFDTFAERMRNRALQRLQKYPQLNNENNEVNTELVHSKQNTQVCEVAEDKENCSDDVKVVKPVIAEHLTIKKSLSNDKMDFDEPVPVILKSRKRNEFILTESNYNAEPKKEDVYVKHCKNRLANLAGKFKQFDEEDNTVPLRPVMQKQALNKRRSPDKDVHSSARTKTARFIAVPKKEEKRPEPVSVKNQAIFDNSRNISSTKKQANSDDCRNVIPSKKEKLNIPDKKEPVQPNTPSKKLLDQSVVKTLESQGYMRTESDAHLFFDFKKARSVFDKDAENSSSKTGNVVDPCFLSVAERRKLFERRLRGEDVEMNFAESSPSGVVERPPVADTRSNVQTPTTVSTITQNMSLQTSIPENNINESEDSNDSVISNSSSKQSEKNDKCDDEPVLNISEETCSSFPDSSNDQETDASMTTYPVLQTVKQVKFVSTPKPGRLYPSVSDLDTDTEDDQIKKGEYAGNIKRNDSFSIIDHDNSFGRDVLCATNSIFSSFQNSRKETNDSIEKSTSKVLDEVKELISVQKDTSFSLSPTSPVSVHSVECPNETASFTYMNDYSDLSPGMSPIPVVKNQHLPQARENKRIGNQVINSGRTEENKKEELNEDGKIKKLEEQVIKGNYQFTQAVEALKLCTNTEQRLVAEKVVLLSKLRSVAAQNEIDRIKVENSIHPRLSAQNIARGNVVISNIKLPVRMAIVMADLKDDICNNLLCIIKCGDIVLSTEVVPVVQTKIRQEPDYTYIEFSDTLSVPEVSSDFRITIEVYNLVVEKKDTSNSKHHGSKKEKKHYSSSKKEKESKLVSKYQSDEKKHSPSSFVMVGYMIFSLNEIKRHQWILNKQDLHHTPLVGMIQMDLKCDLALTTVQKHGFLTMYEVISGYGAWSRYWFYLSDGKLSFWRYPEEEAVKNPIGTFDLRKCVTNLVDVVGIEVTMRVHTFMLKFSPPSYLLGFKGLTEEGLLLSADNLEERIGWCLCLNEVLKSIRLWSMQLSEKL